MVAYLSPLVWEMLEKHDLLGSLIQDLTSKVCASNGISAIPSQFGGKQTFDDDESGYLSSKGSAKRGMKNDIVNLTSSTDRHAECLLKAANIAALQQERIVLQLGEV